MKSLLLRFISDWPKLILKNIYNNINNIIKINLLSSLFVDTNAIIVNQRKCTIQPQVSL